MVWKIWRWVPFAPITWKIQPFEEFMAKQDAPKSYYNDSGDFMFYDPMAKAYRAIPTSLSSDRSETR